MTVSDAHGAPIPDAAAYLRPAAGGIPYIATCDASGTAWFHHVRAGFYDLHVSARGYDSVNKTIDFAEADVAIKISVVLAPHLQTIASVKSRVRAEERILRRDAGLGKISTSLVDLLNMAGGISVRVGRDGSLLGVSLHGEDPSLTSTSFNGVTLDGSAALRALDSDLLQTAAVSDAKESVDFTTLGPSPYPIYDAREMLNGFAGREFMATLQGTSGKVGVAGAMSMHGQESSLSGATYADTSGLAYRHTGGYRNVAGDAKLYAPLGENLSVHAEGMLRSSHTRPIPTFFSGALPQGFGPGIIDEFGSSIFTLSADGYAGQWSLHGTDLNLRESDTENALSRIVNGVPFPGLTRSPGGTSALSFSAVRPLRGGALLNLNFGSSHTRAQLLQFAGSFYGSVPQSTADFHSNYFSVNINRSTGPWSLSMDVDFAHEIRPISQNVLRQELDITRNGRSGQQIFGTFAWGSKLGPPLNVTGFDTPAAAQYDCANDAVIAGVPNDQPAAPHQLGATLGVSQSGGRSSISVEGYFHAYRGMTLTQAVVAGQSLPQSFFPPGYLQQLQQGFSAYGGCPPLAALPTVYVTQDVAGLGVNYAGIDIVGGHRFGSRLSTQLSLGYHRATLISGDARVQSALSPYIVGHQVPLVAPLQASFTADYRIGNRSELLANVTAFSNNNDHNLHSYAKVTIGGVQQLSAVTSLTFIATNVSHAFVGNFSTPALAFPFVSATGRVLPTIGSPLQQPDIYAALRFRIERAPPELP